MVGRTAVIATALGLAAGTTLVVVPSATIRVTGASTPVSATVVAPLAEAGARTIDVGPIELSSTVATTGVRPAQPATGTVHFTYEPGFLGGFGFGIGAAAAGAGCAIQSIATGFGGGTPPPCARATPWPAPARSVYLPAGTRLDDAPWPPPDTNTPHSPRVPPRVLVTTAPVTIKLDGTSGAVPVRAQAAGPEGNAAWPQTISVVGGDRYYNPPTGVYLGVDLDPPGLTGGVPAAGPAVSQHDLDTAEADMRTRLGDRLDVLVLRGVQPDEESATPVVATPAVVGADHAAGDVVPSFAVTGRISGQATALQVDGLRRLALDALRRQVHGAHVLAASVRWERPSLPPAKPGGALLVSFVAHGVATALDLSLLRSAAAWHGSGNVADAVHRFAPRAQVNVTRGFGWSPALVFIDRRAGVVVDGYLAD